MKHYEFLNGNEAVAYGVKLSKPHVVAAYPITPQTKAVEKISQFVQSGEMECKYMHVESEHSAMACSLGASSVGARTFTATSSQGLLYMAEVLPYVSGSRLPVVMMNANRAMATPWNIYGDQSDSMYLLNSGWVQIYVENAQEALDMVIQSYKLAEDHEILLPVMINLDGFVLTHTYEKVEIPNQSHVDAYLKPIVPAPHTMCDESKMSMCITAGNQDYMEFKVKDHLDMFKVFDKLNEVDKSYADQFGRAYNGSVDSYRTEDADAVLITTGSVTGTAKKAVDMMREEGKKVGVVKLRLVRPFPVDDLLDNLNGAKSIGVLDKNISYGYEGTIFTNVNSALLRKQSSATTKNFIAGLGGRDISIENIVEMFGVLLNGEADTDTVSYYNMRCKI